MNSRVKEFSKANDGSDADRLCTARLLEASEDLVYFFFFNFPVFMVLVLFYDVTNAFLLDAKCKLLNPCNSSMIFTTTLINIYMAKKINVIRTFLTSFIIIHVCKSKLIDHPLILICFYGQNS